MATLHSEIDAARRNLAELSGRIKECGLSIEVNGVRQDATSRAIASLNAARNALGFYIDYYVDRPVVKIEQREH